jgi:anaerobic magnesium-protoporphyrin IX monomethyl ester cyclase
MLIQLPHFYGDDSRPPTIYPLGIGYLASVLKDSHELEPMDLWADSSSIDQALKSISKKVPDVFCISVYSTQYPYFKELINGLKKQYPQIKIIAGGPGATYSWRIFMEKTAVDYCVIGEGEVTLPELLQCLDDPSGVKGIAYRHNGKTLITSYREQIANLDSIPLPDRSFFDIERYIHNSLKQEGFRSGNLIAGRGCPYKCTFCSRTFEGTRSRSVDAIVEEIRMLKEQYFVELIDFNDELVIISKQRTLALCKLLQEVEIKWSCQGRVNLVDEEILTAMKSAGCIAIGYGVEAYDQSILDSMKKKIRVEQIIPVIEMTKQIGLKPIIQYMYGFPGENASSIQKTIEFFKAIDEPYYGSTTTPLPGTEIYQEVMRRNLIKDEEQFLLQLTSGYNENSALINLTDLTNKEFLTQKTYIRKEVNRAYYKKHPIVYLKLSLNNYVRLSKMLFCEPSRFWRKFLGKLNRIVSGY